MGTGLSHALLVLLSHLTNTQTETPFNPASLISRPHPPSCAVSACCYRLPTTRIYPILDLPRGSLRSRDPSSHKLSHQITLQKSVTPPANQRQDDENMVYGRLFCPRHYAPTDGNLQKQQQQKDEQAQGK